MHILTKKHNSQHETFQFGIVLYNQNTYVLNKLNFFFTAQILGQGKWVLKHKVKCAFEGC